MPARLRMHAVAFAQRKELVRIQRDALLAHLEVQVRAGHAAGGADDAMFWPFITTSPTLTRLLERCA